MSLTGANADTRIKQKPSEVMKTLVEVYKSINGGSTSNKAALEITKALQTKGSKAVVFADGSKAAQVLHMAQPPLSIQLKQLEEELGITLLKRGNKQIELTDAVKDYNLANSIKFSEENLEVTESIHKPFENDQLNLYSFSTINVKAGDVAKTYQFKQTYKDKLLMTCWFKLTNTLTTIFLLSDNDENHYIIAEYLKTENCLQLKFYQDQQQLRLISLSLTGFSKDDFIGFVMYDMSEIDNTVACMLINSNREIIVETIEPLQTSDKHFAKLSIYGQLYYSLLRVCIYPDLPENDFEELMFNNLLPKKKHFAIIDNATPSLTYDRFS
jgi:hypothetical protein